MIKNLYYCFFTQHQYSLILGCRIVKEKVFGGREFQWNQGKIVDVSYSNMWVKLFWDNLTPTYKDLFHN